MKIEKLGVKITDTPWTITVTPPVEIGGEMRGIRFADQGWTREATEQVRDALTAALAEYDAMTATAPAPVFMVGQMLTGDEDLPVGTVVRDGMSDKWHCLKPGRYSMNEANPEPNWSLSEIIGNYGRTTIVSLP